MNTCSSHYMSYELNFRVICPIGIQKTVTNESVIQFLFIIHIVIRILNINLILNI